MKETLKDTYKELASQEIVTYVEVDNQNSSYDFDGNTAKDEYFKIEVRPYYLTEDSDYTL